MARARGTRDVVQEPAGYGELLEDLKSRIQGAQVRAAVAVNRELIGLYWDVGRAIVERQQRQEWGSSVIERLSRDLQAAFPGARGFSPRNLWRMRRFYVAYADPAFLPQPVAEFEDVFPPQAAPDVQSVILPQPVAEIGDAPLTQAGLETEPAILPRPVAESSSASSSRAALEVQSAILPDPVAEFGNVPPTQAGWQTQPAILPQPVAEFGSVPPTQAGWQTQPPILPQPVAEIGDGRGAPAGSEMQPAILPQVVAELPWGHNIVLLEKLRGRAERLWYAEMATRHGWSRNVLVHRIESGLRGRTGRAVTNFDRTLPGPQSDLARELLKDPYHFGFLHLGAGAQERDVERALLANVRDFLMELGVGFALIGSQYHLEVGGQDYYLDLLFFHVRLRCYVVVELKIGAFQPEDAGKMNFYLAAVDDLIREKEHRRSIGLILCKERNRVVVEYALQGTTKPIGVAEFRTPDELPEQMRDSLPTLEELEARLGIRGE